MDYKNYIKDLQKSSEIMVKELGTLQKISEQAKGQLTPDEQKQVDDLLEEKDLVKEVREKMKGFKFNI